MRLIDRSSADAFLRESGWIDRDEPIELRPLLGGVSNMVLYVSRQRGDDMVLKQAREQLRVPQPWFCSVERIWREVEVMRLCEQVLSNRRSDVSQTSFPAITIPLVLFEDRENYVFAMSAAGPHEVWKTQLLEEHVEASVATACGYLMGALHAGTWQDATVAQRIGNQQFFIDLRIDPYYRHVASVHTDLSRQLSRLIKDVTSNSLSLVHGDFSPKNLLVHPDASLTLVDCEVGHFGDPAFDVGFFVSHLVLKAIRVAPRHQTILELLDAFLASYRQQMQLCVKGPPWRALSRRAVLNFAGCGLARVDGKSQVDYLKPERQQWARQMCRTVLGQDELELERLSQFTAEALCGM